MPYYVVFSRYTNELRAFELIRHKYVEMTPADNRLWFRKLSLGLGLWNGTWDGHDRLWLRWYDTENKWIPTRTEKAEQADLRAGQERAKAEQERAIARQERAKAEQEKAKARQAYLRAEQLAAKLESLGISGHPS